MLAAAPTTYDGMAKIRNCSASIVEFAGQKDSDKVLLLTNGHCVSKDFATIDAMINQPYSDVATVYRGNTPLIVGSLTVDKIIYATMTNTDIAILRTNMSYGDLKQKLRISPREISSALPKAGDNVSAASGNLEQRYTCKVDGIAQMVKEDKWQWIEVARLVKSEECNILPGASGTPVVDKDGKIVAMINTGNQNGRPCTLNNPCEVDASGHTSVNKDAFYAIDIRMLNACFKNGELDISSACSLTKPQVNFAHSLPLIDTDNHRP